jgi:hypothetical protein
MATGRRVNIRWTQMLQIESQTLLPISVIVRLPVGSTIPHVKIHGDNHFN